MLMQAIYFISASLFAGIIVHYLSHRIPWALEREWLDESLDFLDLEEQRSLHSQQLAYPHNLPGPIGIWPFVDKEKALDGPYSPWWLSGLLMTLSYIFYTQYGLTIAFGSAVLFILITVLASRIDYCHQILPDKLNYVLLWSGLAVNSLTLFTPLTSAVWAVLLGYGMIGGMTYLLSIIFKRTMMGGGDIKFIAGLGAWVGVKGLLPVIMIASLLFVLVMVLGGWLSDQWHRMSAFGPYLTIGGLITLWLGPTSLFATMQSWLSF